VQALHAPERWDVGDWTLLINSNSQILFLAPLVLFLAAIVGTETDDLHFLTAI
jgi:hypothetical protein